MALDFTPNFDAPIPGQSLTAPLGDRPWQRPPRFAKADDALAFYVERITTPRAANQMFDVLEMGVPIASLVDAMQLSGVMEGLHTVDVAVLVNPILVELMEGLAKNADVSYKVGDTDGEEIPDQGILTKAMASLSEIDKEELEIEMQDIEDETNPVEKKGLMSRKGVN